MSGLTEYGREYVLKHGLVGDEFEIVLFDGGEDEGVVSLSDVSSEPGNKKYERMASSFTFTGDSEIVNDSVMKFSFNDVDGELFVDSVAVVKEFDSDVGGGRDSYVLAVLDFDEKDVSYVDELLIASEDLSISLDE